MKRCEGFSFNFLGAKQTTTITQYRTTLSERGCTELRRLILFWRKTSWCLFCNLNFHDVTKFGNEPSRFLFVVVVVLNRPLGNKNAHKRDIFYTFDSVSGTFWSNRFLLFVFEFSWNFYFYFLFYNLNFQLSLS